MTEARAVDRDRGVVDDPGDRRHATGMQIETRLRKRGIVLTEAQGREAARLSAMNAVAILKAELGDLDRVQRIVKLTGWERCTDGFGRQP